MIKTIYNKRNTAIQVEIKNYTSDFEVVTASIQSNDISDNIFTSVLGTELNLQILSLDDSIYTGSLVGKEINITINNQIRHFTIISNVGSMPANYNKEVIQISAVDDITLLKNVRYNERGYKTLKDIFTDILSDFCILSGWGGTTDLLNLTFNIDSLYTDDNNTAPTKYTVIESIIKYINRSLFYDYTNKYYVLFNANNITVSQSAVKVIKGTQTTFTYNLTSVIIDANSIAQSDRSVSLLDAWNSAQITSQFDDIKVIEPSITYRTTVNEGTYTAGKKTIKYSNYFGENGGYLKYNNTIKSLADLSLTNIQTAVSNGEYGACWVNQGSEDITGTTDAEGVRSGSEYLMLYGCNNIQQTIMGEYVPIKLFDYTLQCNTIITDSTYLIFTDKVIYSDYPTPEQSNKFTCYRPNLAVYIKYTMSDDTDSTQYYAGISLDFNGNADQQKGNILNSVNNVVWGDRLHSNGYKIKLPNSSKPVKSITLYVSYGLWYGSGVQPASNGIGSAFISNTARPSQYEFHQFDIKLDNKALIDENLFDTDTIYKAVNDDANNISINGNEFEETAVFTTFDEKKVSPSCVYITSYGALSLAGQMTDEKNYYKRNCVSEERRVADIANYYFRTLFAEQITIKGIQPLFGRFYDNYFNKAMILTSANISLTDGNTTLNLTEI